MMARLIRFLKEPGGIRIAVGAVIVCTVCLLALSNGRFLRFSPSFLDSEWILEPPALGFFRAFLVTDRGLNNLERVVLAPAEAAASGEDFSYLEERPSGAVAERKESGHWFGTDKDGRDLLALIVAGCRTALLPGLVACLFALGLGIPLGLLGGYLGGRWAEVIQFANSVVLSFPRLVLILVVICALDPDVYLTMAVLGITAVPRISEIMRTRVGQMARSGFILAARESGLSDWKILWRHLFWYQNRTVFFIQASLVMADSILVETTLSYLQFGTKPPAVSWGNIIEGSRMAFFSEYYWITFFPAAAIVIAILGFFYLADGLNVRLEHRERR